MIPARGGSKGLPGKNIRRIAGKPLIAHSIIAAQKSELIDEVIVSTDSAEIRDVSLDYSSKVLVRPKNLSDDNALVADAIRDLLSKLDETYDYLILLEPTSPLRKIGLIDDCIRKMIGTCADSIATFSQSTPLGRIWTIKGGDAALKFKESNPWSPRQKQEQCFSLNGLLYGIDVNNWFLSKSNSLIFGKSVSVVIDEFVIDIDTASEFEAADLLMRSDNE